MFKDRNGDDLADGTDVRVKIMFDAYQRKKFSAVGTLADGKITITEELDIPANLLHKIKRSADTDGYIHGSICGAAYVEPNNETLSSAIKTNLGLNAVRNEAGALGKDMGNGEANSLQQYNKLYTADTESEDRKHVLFEADGTPKKDQRQIVATVYPTVTNTFPWALTHRRKLGFLDKLMTMEADGGIHSLFYRVYRMNRSILESIPMDEDISDKDYPIDMYDNLDWTYNHNSVEEERLSVIGALVTIIGNPSEPSTNEEEQPVRRALWAAKILGEDYRNARASRLGNFGVGNQFIEYVSGTKIREDGSDLDSYDDLGNLIDITARNEYESMANAIRLRHLPAILASAGSDQDTGEPASPVLEAYPYSDPAYAYYNGNPYEYGAYDTTIRTEEVPCEVTSATGTDIWAMRNSIVNTCVSKTVKEPLMVEELYRSAELNAINFGDALANDNILRPQVYRYGSGTDMSWMDAIDAFTKIISPDNIPVPKLETGFDYGDVFTVGTNDDQLPFIMSDAYGYYKLLNGWDGDNDFIATTMPTDDSLAMFLKEYVPSYAARLSVRNWDSYRVKVVDGTSDSGDTTYLTRMKWYDQDCDAASRGIYAADAFLVDTEFADMNLNRIEFADSDEALALNCSVPPYTVKTDYNKLEPFATENDPYSVSYIRVFMKFMFSEDAGRWYCIDYRQAPVSYLSPLYGAKALDQYIDGKKLWVRPACDSASWKTHMYHAYEEYRPLDINPELAHVVTQGKQLYVPSENMYSYQPARNKNNQCIDGWTFTYIPGIKFYHVHLVVEATRKFKFMPNKDDARVVMQGSTHKFSNNAWVWESANIICNRIKSQYSITDMVNEGKGFVLPIDVDVYIPDDWAQQYDMMHIGLRTDYSDGNGYLTIRDFKVTLGEKMLMIPYLPASEGGLGLNAPINRLGTNTPESIRSMPHANFWSVREYIRPAMGATTFGDIPRYYKDGDEWKWDYTGGIMSDSVLWGQYDYPMKGDPEYHIPDTDIPDADLSKRALIYGQRNLSTGIIDTGDIQVGSDEGSIISVSYGTGRE
jgi:hypothetical protein